MNDKTIHIKDGLKLDVDKPASLPLLKKDNLNIFTIGLNKEQILPKHKANVPTFLTVLSGRIEFKLPEETVELNECDFFHIPVGIEHEVVGKSSMNIFMLTQLRELP